MNTTELIRHFRQRIAHGPVFGPFSKTSDPVIVETLGHAGFDFFILDMEQDALRRRHPHSRGHTENIG